jgi:hypothetical protein
MIDDPMGDDQLKDEPLDERLRDAALAYHLPPAAPREAMWARIQAARPSAAGPAPAPGVLQFRPRRSWWMATAAAAAAVLAVGIGIGRVSVQQTAQWQGPSANATTYRLATQEHLSQAETFLTLFRTSVEERSNQRLASASARHLLASNRLLLDSPAATDRSTRLLLEDLELVLAQIAQLSPQSPAEDLRLIREGIEWGNVMPRLRTAVPAGSAPTQGVL